MQNVWYRLGSTDYLTDNVAGKPTSYTEYDDWGAMVMKPILQLGTRELDLVSEYTGHPYDQVLNLYFAEARMYDAADRRFTAVDPVKGTIANAATLVQYTYVLDNPVGFVDPWGLVTIMMNHSSVEVDNFVKDGQIYVNVNSAMRALGYIATNTGGSASYHLKQKSYTKNGNKQKDVDINIFVYTASTRVTPQIVVNGTVIERENDTIVSANVGQLYQANLVNTFYLNLDYFNKLLCDFTIRGPVIRFDYGMRTSSNGRKFIICEEAPSSSALYEVKDGKITGFRASKHLNDGNITTGIGKGIPMSATDELAKYGLRSDMTEDQLNKVVMKLEVAKEIFYNELLLREEKINQFLNENEIALTQYQYDALADITYNMSRWSTMWAGGKTKPAYPGFYDFIKSGKGKYDVDEAHKQFTDWNGNENRRKRDADLFNYNNYNYTNNYAQKNLPQSLYN